MARCNYCGKSAGLLRKYHPQCHDRYENAIIRIPTFFSKIMSNSLDVQRFSQLLFDVAETSHIPPDTLKSISLAGLNGIIDEILHQRPISAEEEQRIIELKDSLNIDATDFAEMEDKLIKSAILRDLSSPKYSQHIEVTGPIPIDLRPNESILWIFNRAKCFQFHPNDKGSNTALSIESSDENLRRSDKVIKSFFPRIALDARVIPLDKNSEDGTGDLVITNLNIYFLTNGNLRLIPISEIGALDLYADGIKIGRTTYDNKARIFMLNDPWFAANLIAMSIIPIHSDASSDI